MPITHMYTQARRHESVSHIPYPGDQYAVSRSRYGEGLPSLGGCVYIVEVVATARLMRCLTSTTG